MSGINHRHLYLAVFAMAVSFSFSFADPLENSIRGEVYDSSTKEVIVGASVTFNTINAATNTSGLYELNVPDLPGGTLSYIVTAPRYNTQMGTFSGILPGAAYYYSFGLVPITLPPLPPSK